MGTVDTFPAMFLGYSVIWGIILLYCITLGAKHRALLSRIEELRGKIEKKPQ